MSIHLEKLIHEFTQWHEKVNRGRVPKRLKQQVINLCHQHTPETLAHALGLKKATVKQWQRRARAANTTTQLSGFCCADTTATHLNKTQCVLP